MNLIYVVLIYVIIYMGNIFFAIDPFIPFMVLVAIHSSIIALNIAAMAFNRNARDNSQEIARDAARYALKERGKWND